MNVLNATEVSAQKCYDGQFYVYSATIRKTGAGGTKSSGQANSGHNAP